MQTASATILSVNLLSIFVMLGLSALLLYARKHFKSGTLTSVFIVTTTVPIYAYNICFTLGYINIASWIGPFAYSAGTAFLPALWLLFHKYLNPDEKFNKIRLLHFLPLIVCFIVYAAYIGFLSFSERVNFLLYKNTHMTGWIECLNITLLVTQTIIYCGILHIYMSRVKKYIDKNFSETTWARNLSNTKSTIIFIFSFVTILILHHLLKTEQSWVLNFFDMALMYHFTYRMLRLPQNKDVDMPQTPIAGLKFDKIVGEEVFLEKEQIERIANDTTHFLRTSKAYLNPSLTIKNVSDAVGTAGNLISYAIKQTHKCDFSEYVNKLRVERAVRTLSRDTDNEQNIDTITFQSGFATKEAFLKAFRKVMGKTPEEFLRDTGSSTTL